MRMTTRLFWCITLYCLFHQQVTAQTLTNQFPPRSQGPQTRHRRRRRNHAGRHSRRKTKFPWPRSFPRSIKGVPVKITAKEQGKRGDVWTLTGEVEIDYRDYIVRADKVTYNEATSEVEATGHLHLEGGRDDELIDASHGTMNLDQETGTFFRCLRLDWHAQGSGRR